MTTVIAYVRVSSDHQSNLNQRQQIESRFQVSKWFIEDGVSGSVPAAQRPAMAALLAYAREGDTVVVVAIDRLGRNTVDVLTTVETLKNKNCSLFSLREGFDLSSPVGKLMLTLLSGVAELEKETIRARQFAGIQRARSEGKCLGRTKIIDDSTVLSWRKENNASIKETSTHFGISTASVKRACSTKVSSD